MIERYTKEELERELERRRLTTEVVIPASIISSLGLRNVNNGGYMSVNEKGDFFISSSNSHYKKPVKKMVDVDCIDEIKVGDFVRCTNVNSWKEINEIFDMGIMLVTNIDIDGELHCQYWNYEGDCVSFVTRFDMWNKWQVGRKIE